MNRQQAFELFRQMTGTASREIVEFTRQQQLEVTYKADKTAVTACDRHIGDVLIGLASKQGLNAVSEENPETFGNISGGDYWIVDPIDGTLGYIDHVRNALRENPGNPTVDHGLGSEFDYSLLMGIVEKGKPRFGCCYNYVTGEIILLDSDGEVTREGPSRNKFRGHSVRYMDMRAKDSLNKDPLNKMLDEVKWLTTFEFRSLGPPLLYAQLNGHSNSIVSHFPQQNGLWDVLPAAVAARSTGTRLLDGNGDPISYTKSVFIPKGIIQVKGTMFDSILNDYLNNSKK